MEFTGYRYEKFNKAPPDKGGILYVAAPKTQGREPKRYLVFPPRFFVAGKEGDMHGV